MNPTPTPPPFVCNLATSEGGLESCLSTPIPHPSLLYPQPARGDERIRV